MGCWRVACGRRGRAGSPRDGGAEGLLREVLKDPEMQRPEADANWLATNRYLAHCLREEAASEDVDAAGREKLLAEAARLYREDAARGAASHASTV